MSTLHKVWTLGADIDTDQLAPGAYMKLGIADIAQHCLEGVRPEFASQAHAGDVIAAGPNFGIGSSREQAAGVLSHLGVAAVIAPSFSGLYFRNAFNLGLLLLTCPRATEVGEGERIDVRFEPGSDTPVVVGQSGAHLPCAPIPGFLMDMVQAGGLLPLLKQQRRSASHGR